MTATGLRRALGLWQVSLAGIGVILGAGVYGLVGPAAARAGNALWLAFLLAGLTAGMTAYSYARLATMRPKDSPEFQYVALAFGNRVGFLAGWLMLAADLLAVTTVAVAFGGYLAHLAGTPVALNALILLAAVAAVTYAGIGESVGLGIVLTVVEVAGLVFVVIMGAPAWSGADYVEMPHGASGVWSAAALIFFAYIGFDELGNFAEEMREPERNLPRALLVAMAASTLMYVLVAISAIATVGWRDLGASEAPLALVAARELGRNADAALSLVALAATANTVLLLVVSAARSVYGMAAAGVLPRRLGRIGGRATPVVATAVVTAVTAALLAIGNLAELAAMTDAAILGSFTLVNLSLPSLVTRGTVAGPRLRRVADVLIPSAATLLGAWLLGHTGAMSLAATAALTVLGLLVYRQRA